MHTCLLNVLWTGHLRCAEGPSCASYKNVAYDLAMRPQNVAYSSWFHVILTSLSGATRESLRSIIRQELFVLVQTVLIESNCGNIPQICQMYLGLKL